MWPDIMLSYPVPVAPNWQIGSLRPSIQNAFSAAFLGGMRMNEMPRRPHSKIWLSESDNKTQGQY